MDNFAIIIVCGQRKMDQMKVEIKTLTWLTS